ncbi:hypothetical protein M409DRAFT_65528 [Zasmidium cellare ATCC 36951]|uniref:VOC domain-containing protein n=1 Tax=Zasmidium cellare ATCC 36951 TaxID=1080233 RepID=A0A6A6CT45_ZASCE|nr:uncharacterized protein M409DRAFT_65528 [Zasmidium cellare ATCC 36951]KAF2168646.1 hypothetical protein M409DRAFT_65528 [Zasmidium cellare ATCC 36951]
MSSAADGVDKRIRLVKTAFVTYFHADLKKARQFLLDFGLTVAQETLRVRSQTGESYFDGAAYVVESAHELERAAALPSSSSKTQDLAGSAGGKIATLTDPFDHKIHLIHGWRENQPSMPESQGLQKLTVNFEDSKPRKGRFQRFAPGPAPVFRWGHYGVSYPASDPQGYQKLFDWYTTTLTLSPSDILTRDGRPVTAFFHIDRGREYTDHHSFYFKAAKPHAAPSVTHAAFETHDFDVQQLGHQHLAAKGYRLCWGVGRHTIGSQVFDYWYDPSGFMVEHYADGDVVNCETGVGEMVAGREALAVWGPPLPEAF